MRLISRALALASLGLLAACATRPTPPPEIPTTVPVPLPVPSPLPPPPPPVGRNAVETGVELDHPRVLGPDEAARALAAFRLSCPAVTTRNDATLSKITTLGNSTQYDRWIPYQTST